MRRLHQRNWHAQQLDGRGDGLRAPSLVLFSFVWQRRAKIPVGATMLLNPLTKGSTVWHDEGSSGLMCAACDEDNFRGNVNGTRDL